MTLEKCRRVIWRLEDRKQVPHCSLKQLKLAIMAEIGMDDRTVAKYVKKMAYMGLIKRISAWRFEVLVTRHDTY